MTQRISSSILVILTIIGISCTQKPIESVEESYELVKTDSFRVDNFTRVVIRDYSEKEGIYLGYSISEDDILELSDTGEILKRIHKKGEGTGYGNWNPIGLAFGPNNERIVELPFQVVAYDSSYEPIHSHRIMSPLPIRANMPLGKTPYFQKNDTTLLLVGPSNYLSASYLIHDQEGKDTLQNFYELNLQSGAVRSVVPFESNSVYELSENVYKGVMGKSFFVDHAKQELVMVQELDTEILIYSLPDFILKKSIPITYSEFITYNPVPIESPFDDLRAQNLGRLSARNQKLFNLENGEYILQYFTGVTESEFESRNSEDLPYFPSQDATEQRILIFKDGKQVGSEIPGIPGTIITILPDRKLLVQEPENTEIEEEFTRFTIYQVKPN
ncbi:hypothetical protein JYB64_12430 [Algoriphagus aestuarii]|nr:hypothetical protein [Algoriphagus aestuarii]